MRTKAVGLLVSVLTVAVAQLAAQVPPPPPGGPEPMPGQRPMPGMPNDRESTPQLPMPGQPQTQKPIIKSSIGGPSLYALPAFKEASVEISATGTAGFTLSLANVPALTFPGNQSLASLLQLVDVVPTETKTSSSDGGASGGATIGNGQIVGPVRDSRIPTELTMVRDQAISTPVSIRKRLLFKGLNRSAIANADRFLRSFDVDLQVTRGGNVPAVAKRITVVLSNDDAPPAIVSLGSEGSSGPNSAASDDFPPLVRPTGAEADLFATKTYKNNWVQLHSKVTVIATDFTVDGTQPSADFKRFYKLITEYQDGTRYEYPYENLGVFNSAAKSLRLQMRVPNIGRGTFRVTLRSAYGSSTPSQAVSFPANTFITSLPVATGPVVAINVDSPLNVGGFETLLGQVAGSYQYTVLPAQPSCNDVVPDEYARWESVSMGNVEVNPVGIGSAKFTGVPATNSIVHSGNMPRIVGTSAGLGTIRAHWSARMKVFVADCPNRRLAE